MMMLDPLSFQLGMDGFIWFIGIVEEVLDPLNLGRVKVRCLGVHELDTDKLSTNDLPWALPIKPVTQSHVPHDLRVRDWVFGFFLDGKLAQQPMILGAIPSIRQKSNG